MGNYISRLHLVGIATLAALTVALALFGWSLRPSSGGFSTVPNDLALFVTKSTGGLSFTETMSHSGADGSALEISSVGLPEVPQHGRWTFVIDNLGAGRLCTPRALVSDQGGIATALAPQHLIRHFPMGNLLLGKQDYSGVEGRGTFYVRLCWPSDGPVAKNGAYLSARFPALSVFVPNDSVGVTRRLNLGSLDASDYAVQSLHQPTSVTQGGWQWAPRLTQILPQPLNFAAVDTSETQHDSYQAFLSGVLFGVAGGALVALIQELVAPFRARRELRPPEPGG